MTNICVIDYGMSNIHSVAKALEKVSDRKFKITIANSINNIKNSSHIVFPGQGAASSCMKNIKNNFEMSELKELITNRFFLGICMGLQVLMTESKEGGTEQCLDIFSGEVEYLGDYQDSKLTLPHMGWNNVTIKHSHDILKGIVITLFLFCS